MKHVKCYIPLYPRPQFVRASYEILNGMWDFAFDPEGRGERDGWYRGFAPACQIRVPFACGSPDSGVAERGKRMWYAKTFALRKKRRGERVLLHFEGADYETKVWVNGKYQGENRGGYARFTFDITDALKPDGTAQVVAECADGYSAVQPRGKQKWEEKPFGCWYDETSGIWKTVWVEYTADTSLARVKITPDPDAYRVRFDCEIAGFCSGLSLRTVVSYDGVTVAEGTMAVKRESLSFDFDLTGEVAAFKVNLWLDHSPSLYDVEYILYRDGEEIDRVGSYFGLKKYGAHNNHVTVNNYPVYLRMVLDQGYFPGGWLTPPTEQDLERDILLVKEMGFNGIRKHQKIEDERFYYLCDVLGVYVWLEMPSAYEFNDGAMERFTEEWTRVVRQYRDHPCIMAYVPFNESWGIQRVFSDRRQQLYTEAVCALTRALTENALVISNDGWEHTKSDLITLHHYAEDGGELSGAYANLEEMLAGRCCKTYPHKFCFADGYRYEGQPVLLSEFGGIAFEADRENGWGYGAMVKDEEAFLQRLASLVDAIYAQPGFAGFCLTQLTDVQQEINGLADFERKPKASLERIRKIIQRR